MLASVIGANPYARMIRYQYTAAEQADCDRRDRRRPLALAIRIVQFLWVPAADAWAYWTRRRVVAVSGRLRLSTWVTANPRVSGASSSRRQGAGRGLCRSHLHTLPHLTHREHLYYWPNPFEAAYWGNDDRYRLPRPVRRSTTRVVDHHRLARTAGAVR